MFVVTEAEAAAIRAVYQQRGEFSAAVELRQRFLASPTTRRCLCEFIHTQRQPDVLGDTE